MRIESHRAGVSTETVLIVCTANVARSPLAAAILRHHLREQRIDHIRIESAGVMALTGVEVLSETRRVAEKRGLDLSAHVVQDLTHDLVQRSDLILAMTEAQRDRVVRAWPSSLGRTFTLVELDRLLPPGSPRFHSVSELAALAHSARPLTLGSRAPEDIADPMGASPSSYERLTEQLERFVTRFADHLRPGS